VAARWPLAIDQVVRFGEIGEPDDAWTRASIAAQAVPTPGPDLPRGSARPFGQVGDPSLPEPAPNAAFDSGRARGTERAIVGTRSKKGVGLVRLPEPFVPLRYPPEVEARFRLDFVERTSSSGRPYREHRSGSDTPVWLAGRPIAGIFRSDKTVGIAYLDDAGERREVRGLPESFAGFDVDASPDGRRGFVSAATVVSDQGRHRVESHVYVIDFATGEARAVWKAPWSVAGVACAGERVLVLVVPDLVLLEVRDDAAAEVARLSLAPKSQERRYWKLLARPDGALAVVRDTAKHNATLVGVVGDELIKLDVLSTKLHAAPGGDLRFLGDHADVYVLDGVDALLAQAAEKTTKRTKGAARERGDADGR
jgi:hypothetical protein